MGVGYTEQQWKDKTLLQCDDCPWSILENDEVMHEHQLLAHGRTQDGEAPAQPSPGRISTISPPSGGDDE